MKTENYGQIQAPTLEQLLYKLAVNCPYYLDTVEEITLQVFYREPSFACCEVLAVSRIHRTSIGRLDITL